MKVECQSNKCSLDLGLVTDCRLKTFNLKYSYTDLADYLAIDRSAMMRELKNLKDEGFIKDVNKKITILY